VISASVVVCTRSRADRLTGCLAHLSDQVPAGVGGEVEVVIVDNGSTDRTADVAAAWCTQDPGRRRLVAEPVAGLSRARNRGIAVARGDVVLFLDDDAVAPRGWVAAHLAAYERDPLVVAVGGPVVLRWPDGRPRWLAPRLDHWFSALDHGEEAGPFPPPHGPYGTNMSVRRGALDAAARAAPGGGPFDHRLGRRGRSLVSGEEGDLFERLWAAGGAIAYEPAALVLHAVTPDRLRRRWVLRRGWAQGRSNALRHAARLARAPAVQAGSRRPGGGRLTRTELTTVCRAEVGMAAHGFGGAVRSAVAGGQAAALDEVARRSGHVAAAVELLWLGLHGEVGPGRRASSPRRR
jgi:glycosyltransferase involved in cell wall biosynthesis